MCQVHSIYWKLIIFVSYLLTRSDNNVEALKDPDNNKNRSALLFSAIIFTFLLAMGLTGIFIEPLYNSANFGR